MDFIEADIMGDELDDLGFDDM
jgi:hypothetical protein